MKQSEYDAKKAELEKQLAELKEVVIDGDAITKPIPIQLHNKQIEALANRATALLFVIDDFVGYTDKQAIKHYSPLQVGNEYYVQEDFYTVGHSDKIYFSDTGYPRCISLKKHPASEMTYEQSRFKFDVVSGEVKKAECFTTSEALKLGFTKSDIGSPTDNLRNTFSDEQYYKSYCFYVVIKQKG